MATKKKAATWSLTEALEQLPHINCGRERDVDKRQMLRAGRTLPELDVIAAAIDNGPEGRNLLGRLAQEDHDMLKAARAAGKPSPAMPFIDELTRRQKHMTSTKADSTRSTGGAKRAPKATGIRFTHDGKLVAATQNKLSSVAWFYTKPLGAGGGRMKVKELLALLTKLGVTDPNAAGWSVKLPNGVTLGAVKEGETPTAIVKPKAEKDTKATKDPKRPSGQRYSEGVKPKKAVAKKAPAAKKTATPKKSTAKKGAASTPLSKQPAPRTAPKLQAVGARKSTRTITHKA